MWTNSLLKKNGWNALKPYYWTAFGVSLVAALLSGNNRGIRINVNHRTVSEWNSGWNPYRRYYEQILNEWGDMFYVVFLSAFFMALVIGMTYMAFLGNPVNVGKCRFYCKARTGDVNFGNLFESFQNGRYMSTVKVMFSMQMQILIGLLLFVVPGVIRAYEYFLVPYLMAENPNLPKERAFEISRKTMENEKMKCFKLSLSFIGWYIVGSFVIFGSFFVNPYYDATMAEFYTCMRAKMISYGITTESELNGAYNRYSDSVSDVYQNPYDMDMNHYQNQNHMNSGYQDSSQPHVNLKKDSDDNNHLH